MKRVNLLFAAVVLAAAMLLVLSDHTAGENSQTKATIGDDPMKTQPHAATLPRSDGSTGLAPAKAKYPVPDDAELRRRLTPLQYEVVRKEGTEPPFQNDYWDNHEQGIYVDIVSGEPLFSSIDKFDSGTGWPSFTRPIAPDSIAERSDTRLFMRRTEVRSKIADAHLGHVFDDGPPPTGLRYCINSAALRFVPKEELEKQGYGEYVNVFK